MFGADVTAELVEGAFRSIRIRGAVIASHEVREAVNRLKSSSRRGSKLQPRVRTR